MKQAYIIDDEVEVAQTLVELLQEGLGIEAKIFTSLDSCLEALQTLTPHIIISDIMMPTGSGLRLTQELKKRNLKVPVIFISGMADRLPPEEGHLILSKPIQKDRLFEVINNIIVDT